MSLSYPEINGLRHDWSSIEFRVRGMRQIGVKEISYRPTLEPSDVYGAGAKPIGRTLGVLKFEGSLTLLKEEADDLIDALGDGFLSRSFDIVVQYKRADSKVVTDKLIGCRIKSPDNSHSQGGDGLVVKMDLHIMDMRLNGKKPVA